MDYNMKELQNLIHRYIKDPVNPYVNADLGEEYEKLGQGAAALSYFFKSIRIKHMIQILFLAYNGILKTWKQLNKTTRRKKL